MIEFQRKLLGDSVRNDALFRALRNVIRPGMTVTDIGSGTGFLSFLALRLGAKHCYLYETSEDLLDLSKRIARTNGLQRRCTYIHSHSRNIRSPIQTDIVISETLGNFAYEEHIIETMNDARRFLRRGGTLIPQMLRQYVAPVVTDRLWKEINVWDGVTLSLSKGAHPTIDFTPAKEVVMNNMYVKTIRPEDLLCSKSPSPQPLSRGERGIRQWDTIDFTKKNRSIREGCAHWITKKATTIYGFAVWWECDLVPGVMLSTSPFEPPTHWKQIFLPLLAPLHMHKDGRLSLRLSSDSRLYTGLNVTWQTGSQNLSLRKGLLCP